MEKLIRQLVERRSEMERDVFYSPPGDWSEFQRRLGQYYELNTLIEELHAAVKGIEKDE